MIEIKEIEQLLCDLGKLYTSTFTVYKYESDLEDFFLIKEEFDGTCYEVRLTSKIYAGLKEMLIQSPKIHNWVIIECQKLIDFNKSLSRFMKYGINAKFFSSFYWDDDIDVIVESD